MARLLYFCEATNRASACCLVLSHFRWQRRSFEPFRATRDVPTSLDSAPTADSPSALYVAVPPVRSGRGAARIEERLARSLSSPAHEQSLHSVCHACVCACFAALRAAREPATQQSEHRVEAVQAVGKVCSTHSSTAHIECQLTAHSLVRLLIEPATPAGRSTRTTRQHGAVQPGSLQRSTEYCLVLESSQRQTPCMHHAAVLHCQLSAFAPLCHLHACFAVSTGSIPH